jgi:hypothetical protein
MPITDSKFEFDASPADLTVKIQAALAAGWQHYGKPFLVPESRNNPSQYICQAMIKGSQVLVGATGDQGVQGNVGPAGPVTTYYGTSASAANAYAITIAGGAGIVAAGNFFAIKLTHAPTGAATWNINGTGAKPVIMPNGAAFAGAQGVDGQTFVAFYDGTSYICIVSPNNA